MFFVVSSEVLSMENGNSNIFLAPKVIKLSPAGHRSRMVEVGIFHNGGELLAEIDGKLKNRV